MSSCATAVSRLRTINPSSLGSKSGTSPDFFLVDVYCAKADILTLHVGIWACGVNVNIVIGRGVLSPGIASWFPPTNPFFQFLAFPLPSFSNTCNLRWVK